jgi:hypothetical protein
VLAGRQSSSIFVSVMAWNLYGNIFKIYVDQTYKLMYHQSCFQKMDFQVIFQGAFGQIGTFTIHWEVIHTMDHYDV